MMAFSTASNRRVEMTAVTSTPHEHMAFNWNVKNFKALVDSAIDKDEEEVAKLSFTLKETLFPLGTPKVTMIWKVEVCGNKGEEEIELYLYLQAPSFLSVNLYVQSTMNLYKDKFFTQMGDMRHRFSNLKKFTDTPIGWGWRNLFPVSNNMIEHLDEEGSLNLALTVDFYVDSDGIAEILPQQDKNSLAQSEIENFKSRKGILLDQVASLLGDEVTSDVILSVRDVENGNVEIGNFFCHSAILSGRSSVLLKKLKESTERKDGRVVLTLKVDVALEVIDIFLCFLYYGKFKDTRDDEESVDPDWVEMLPGLVKLAHKFFVVDLLDLCDVHLHRAVTRDNVLEILALAHRYGLNRSLAKLRRKFSKDSELLLQSVTR